MMLGVGHTKNKSHKTQTKFGDAALRRIRGLLLLPRDFLVLSRYGAGLQGT